MKTVGKPNASNIFYEMFVIKHIFVKIVEVA